MCRYSAEYCLGHRGDSGAPKRKCFEMIKNLGLEVGWRMLLGHPYLQGKKTKALSMMREVL